MNHPVIEGWESFHWLGSPFAHYRIKGEWVKKDIKEDVAMSRANDPVIKKILQRLREVNIQNPEYAAIKKILEEGVDGRYLGEKNERETIPVNQAD